MKIYSKIDQLVGSTPLLELTGIEKKYNLSAKIYAKLEFFNPTGSIKDRAALQMILDAERDGRISSESTIIEPTSGNTGIGLAAIGVSRGYKVIIVMPDTMSEERIALMKAYGAKVVLSDGTKGMNGAITEAEKLCKSIENSVIMGQFNNISNSVAHYETTGPEIVSDTDGDIDALVCCVGTGGTITGTAKYLRENIRCIDIIAVEPDDSPVLSEGRAGSHKIQGIGAGFVPDVLDTNSYDAVMRVSNDDAYKFGREVASTDGVLVGISSGAALAVAVDMAKSSDYENKKIVVIFPDSGSRYLSTENYFI